MLLLFQLNQQLSKLLAPLFTGSGKLPLLFQTPCNSAHDLTSVTQLVWLRPQHRPCLSCQALGLQTSHVQESGGVAL